MFSIIGASSTSAISTDASHLRQDQRKCRMTAWQTTASLSALVCMGIQPLYAQSNPNPATSEVDAVSSPGDAENTNDIVVLGVRGAQQAAVAIKRLAPQIVDSIVAEDIGKLPDTTIADSLQRVPGIQIQRSAGEGSRVNIRGLGQVLTTINGERFLGGSNIDGAQPDFTDIPPTLFSGVDVFKSPTARQVEGGVSGIIDLKTRRPFDLKSGLTLSGAAEGSYGDQVKKFNPTVSALAGYRGDRFGFLIAGSYTHATLANITNDANNGFVAVTDQFAGRDLRGDGVNGLPASATDTQRDNSTTGYFEFGNYAYQPNVVNLTNRSTERDRYGLNASAQYELSDSLTIVGDLSYTKLEQRDRSVSLQVNSGYTYRDPGPDAQIDENGVETAATFQLDGSPINSSSIQSKSNALNTNLQIDYKNDGPFTGSLRWVHGDAKRTSIGSYADSKAIRGAQVTRGDTAECRANPALASCRTYANPNGLPFIRLGVDYSGSEPALNFITPGLSDPSVYNLMSTWAQGDRRTAKSDVFRADGSYDFGDGFLKSVDVGGRYATRDIRVSNYKYLASVTVPGLGLLDQPGDLYFYKDPQIGHTGRPEIQGLSVLPLYSFASIPQYVRNFSNFQVSGLPAGGIPAIDPAAMDDAIGFQNSLFPGNQPYLDPTTSFRVKERTATGYIQANFGGEIGLPFSGNAGLRAIHTERSIYANTTDPNNFIGTGGSYNGVAVNLGTNKTTKKFWRFLPSFNLNVETATDQRLRLAFAKVVGELDLYSLGAGRVLYYSVNNGRYPNLPDDLQIFQSGNSGNPNLEPYQSTNYNVSYEWYFGRGGVLSAAAFLFDVKSFPQPVTTIQPIPDQDGVVRAGGAISTTGNGGGGKIKGVELGYQQQFDFLPGVLSGLGLNLNYTYSDSSSANVDLFGKKLPVPDNSKHQFNVVGLYQKGPVQARVAYNWRSERFAQLVPVNGTIHPTPDKPNATDNLAAFAKPIGYLDASVSYDVTPNVTIYAQGNNLTASSDQQYLQFKNLFFSQTLNERRFVIGFRIRN